MREIMTRLLQDVAREFWAEKGARFGQKQRVSELTVNPDESGSGYGALPSTFTPETEFLCSNATVEGYGIENRIIIALWGYKIKKDGNPHQYPIRITWLYTDEQNRI